VVGVVVLSLTTIDGVDLTFPIDIPQQATRFADAYTLMEGGKDEKVAYAFLDYNILPPSFIGRRHI
jgi:hypothetical protein